MSSPFERMQELAAAGIPFAVATVVRTQGSTPQVVGAKLILTGAPGERPFGTLGGGCVEADAIHAARDVLAGNPPSLREYQLTEELAWNTGLVCGGTMWILAERGATVNDAVLAVSTGALRRLFEQRGAAIPGEFSALVPMSIRKPGEELTLGNRITTLIVPLPLGEADPAERLRRIHETTARLKDSEAARAASLVIEASGWVPPTVSRVLGSIGAAGSNLPVERVIPQRLPWNLVISNVPGPPMPVYLLGRRLESIHPFVPLSPQRRGLSIGVISYDGGLYFGFTGDRDRLPDLDDFAGFIAAELAAIGA